MSRDKKFKLIEWAKENAPRALGKAMEIAGDVTGIKVLNSLGDVIAGENPDQLDGEELLHAKELRELDIEELELIFADMANARNREIELVKAGKKTDPMMMAAGTVILLAFSLMVLSVIFTKPMGLDVESNPLFHQLMGIIEGVALSVFGYYYGTSKSSSDKTQVLLNNKTKKQ